MKYRDMIEEDLCDTIINDDSSIIDFFLGNRDDLEYQVSEKLNKLSDEDLEDVWDTYCGYYTIDEFIKEHIEEE